MMMTDAQNKPRSLDRIAMEIASDWRKQQRTFPAAEPYRYAMASMTSVNNDYGADSGRSVVLYFLSNVATWRGDTAKRIKAELKQALRDSGYKIK